jgi:RES domain-containing protein
MILYRLGPSEWIDVWDGMGSAKSGARWNSIKVPAIYCGSSQALSVLEVRVHSGEIPNDYAMATFELPDPVSIYTPSLGALPTDWRKVPPNTTTQKFGDAFIAAGTHLLMRVPSVVVPEEWNYVMNPAHPDMAGRKLLRIQGFTFDERLYDVKKK